MVTKQQLKEALGVIWALVYFFASSALIFRDGIGDWIFQTQ